MTKVDSRGRIVPPQEVREGLDITPGTEVVIHEEDGQAIVRPKPTPDEVIERMEQLIENTSSKESETNPITEEVDPIARKHSDSIRRGADNSTNN